ncbi:MAG TPA: acyltransferase [Actinomycetota bacterium]|nr:acyltransferase [Actinomycetota bacterium]
MAERTRARTPQSEPAHPAMLPPAHPERGRDELIDLLRSLATSTVVLWHWVFTILVWRADGPHADNPIGYVSGLWSLTWVLQVMPLFFVAGGFVHARAWARDRGKKGAWAGFVKRRAVQLGIPALILIAVVATAGTAIGLLHEGGDPWITRGVLLVLSPLWFLVVYMVLVATVPLWDWLDRRWGELVPIAMVAGTMGVDLIRFRFDHPEIAWLNMVLVWGAAHQVGWSWRRLREAPVRFGHALMLIGFSGLIGLTNMGLYPRSMVGTTSTADRFSNMGPPTLPILALLIFQLGLVVAYRQRILELAEHPRMERFTDWLSANAMPLFLWHSVGFAIFYAAMRAVMSVPEEPSALWWVTRPLWLVGPALVTVPLIALTKRIRVAM